MPHDRRISSPHDQRPAFSGVLIQELNSEHGQPVGTFGNTYWRTVIHRHRTRLRPVWCDYTALQPIAGPTRRVVNNRETNRHVLEHCWVLHGRMLDAASVRPPTLQARKQPGWVQTPPPRLAALLHEHRNGIRRPGRQQRRLPNDRRIATLEQTMIVERHRALPADKEAARRWKRLRLLVTQPTVSDAAMNASGCSHPPTLTASSLS